MECRQLTNKDGLRVVEAYERERRIGVIIPLWDLFLVQPVIGKNVIRNNILQAVRYLERNAEIRIRKDARLGGRRP